MAYSVKEIFYSLQGEGRRVGRPAVFCRFAGCNLWSGREEDRAKSICRFCDTEFVGTDGSLGGKFDTATGLANRIASLWPERQDRRYAVLTGGEPLLQVDTYLIRALHAYGFEVAVETNGSLEAPEGIDWLCVSPKANAPWVLRKGDELKLAYPQKDLLPDAIADCEFEHYLIQPIDGPEIATNTQSAIAFCRANTKWNLSLQTHKILKIR
jgi:7-carboxy-7-deazaguanine synthase (Cx14CxxC type)